MAIFRRIPNFLMYTMAIQVLAMFQLKITKIGDNIAKNKYCLRLGSYLALLLPKLCSQYPNLKECPNFLRYTMEMQVVLAEY